jgi:hypothetical protein
MTKDHDHVTFRFTITSTDGPAAPASCISETDHELASRSRGPARDQCGIHSSAREMLAAGSCRNGNAIHSGDLAPHRGTNVSLGRRRVIGPPPLTGYSSVTEQGALRISAARLTEAVRRCWMRGETERWTRAGRSQAHSSGSARGPQDGAGGARPARTLNRTSATPDRPRRSGAR